MLKKFAWKNILRIGILQLLCPEKLSKKKQRKKRVVDTINGKKIISHHKTDSFQNEKFQLNYVGVFSVQRMIHTSI